MVSFDDHSPKTPHRAVKLMQPLDYPSDRMTDRTPPPVDDGMKM